eukprot:679914-Rhodomonas_salina.3
MPIFTCGRVCKLWVRGHDRKLMSANTRRRAEGCGTAAVLLPCPLIRGAQRIQSSRDTSSYIVGDMRVKSWLLQKQTSGHITSLEREITNTVGTCKVRIYLLLGRV